MTPDLTHKAACEDNIFNICFALDGVRGRVSATTRERRHDEPADCLSVFIYVAVSTIFTSLFMFRSQILLSDKSRDRSVFYL